LSAGEGRKAALPFVTLGSYECFQVTVKSVLLFSPDVAAFPRRAGDLSIRSIELGGNVPIAWPSTRVPVKPTLPKFVKTVVYPPLVTG
jgi:hypothetical protein